MLDAFFAKSITICEGRSKIHFSYAERSNNQVLNPYIKYKSHNFLNCSSLFYLLLAYCTVYNSALTDVFKIYLYIRAYGGEQRIHQILEHGRG